jgi:hypothetical protein
MANIRKELGRHQWKETVLKRGHERVPHSLICMNCRAYRYGDDSAAQSPPVTGCLSDVDMTRLGKSRLNDHMDHEMARRKALDDADLAEAESLGLNADEIAKEMTGG